MQAAALDTRGPDAMAKAADLASRPPVTQFVVMELRMASRLVSSVNHQLQDLKKVVYGSGLLTPVRCIPPTPVAHAIPSPRCCALRGALRHRLSKRRPRRC